MCFQRWEFVVQGVIPQEVVSVSQESGWMGHRRSYPIPEAQTWSRRVDWPDKQMDRFYFSVSESVSDISWERHRNSIFLLFTLYYPYLSIWLGTLFVFLPCGENLVVILGPFNQPLARFSYSFMCCRRNKYTAFFIPFIIAPKLLMFVFFYYQPMLNWSYSQKTNWSIKSISSYFKVFLLFAIVDLYVLTPVKWINSTIWEIWASTEPVVCPYLIF